MGYPKREFKKHVKTESYVKQVSWCVLGTSASKRPAMHVGYFDIEADAAKAYDEQAIIEHGAYANLNFP